MVNVTKKKPASQEAGEDSAGSFNHKERVSEVIDAILNITKEPGTLRRYLKGLLWMNGLNYSKYRYPVDLAGLPIQALTLFRGHTDIPGYVLLRSEMINWMTEIFQGPAWSDPKPLHSNKQLRIPRNELAVSAQVQLYHPSFEVAKAKEIIDYALECDICGAASVSEFKALIDQALENSMVVCRLQRQDQELNVFLLALTLLACRHYSHLPSTPETTKRYDAVVKAATERLTQMLAGGVVGLMHITQVEDALEEEMRAVAQGGDLQSVAAQKRLSKLLQEWNLPDSVVPDHLK